MSPHPALVIESPAPSKPEPAPRTSYLRRVRSPHPRPRPRQTLPIALGLALVTSLLFVRVWQVTSAHALAMEKDTLRKDVHALENRIRLSSDLAVQEALREGLDYAVLAKQGFHSPGPDALVDVDLARPYPRVVSRQGAMARLSADVGRFVRGILPARRGAPEANVQPVSAEIVP